ncbi:M15 family metallopeptidase [Muriicola sp.]|uniref:M15 family metallopeptidase n=1 Tax=Muriicola sp. TaxID=2020856 RepID=UPI003C70884B
MKKIICLIVVVFIAANCREKEKDVVPEQVLLPPVASQDSVPAPVETRVLPTLDGISDTTFIRLADYNEDFAYELRYATENNFLKTKVYDCAECYTRKKTAKALIAANKVFLKKGFRIRFFDCYRPNSVQYEMWKIFPNPQYVADPAKGSIHNKGGAVDITLETLEGDPLDMGTDFDFFGREAHHDNRQLPEEVLENRGLLKEVMEANGFWSVRTEWWHYNLSSASNDPVANFRWDCP